MGNRYVSAGVIVYYGYGAMRVLGVLQQPVKFGLRQRS